jgi:hypothetical protein
MTAEEDITVEWAAPPTAADAPAADTHHAAVGELPVQTAVIPTLVERARVQMAVHPMPAMQTALRANRAAAVGIPAAAVNRMAAAGIPAAAATSSQLMRHCGGGQPASPRALKEPPNPIRKTPVEKVHQ